MSKIQITRSIPRACRAQRLGRNQIPIRCLSIPASPPHAYLKPLEPLVKEANSEVDLSGVMSLVLDRKETKNALSIRMVGELRESIAKVQATSSARILLLHTPHPKMFCSGADLRERSTMSPAAVSTFLDSLRGLLSDIEGLRIPTIAVIDGYALGGGCELALGCDLRIGGPDSLFALPEAKLGIIPGAGGTQRLTRLVGISKAKELIYTGRRIEGIEAEKIGLVNTCAKAPTTAWETALLLTSQILTSAPLALQAAKSAIAASADPSISLEAGLDRERELYNGLLGTYDRDEGLKAFKEKRPAVFQGR